MKKLNLIGFTLAFSLVGAVHGFERALFIGDSHSYGNFGNVIDKYLREQSNQVVSISSCGSSPSTWVNNSNNFKATNCGYWRKTSDQNEIRVKSQKLDTLQNELMNLNPQLVIVSLGTNILSSSQNIKNEIPKVEILLSQIQKVKAQCIWIGPPDLSRSPFSNHLKVGIKALQEVIEKNNCRFIDSTKITKYPTGKLDGIHYDTKGSSNWGFAVIPQLQQMINSTNSKTSSKMSSKKETPQPNSRNNGGTSN